MTIPVAIMAVLLLASGGVWCLVFTGRIPRPFDDRPETEAPPKVNFAALALVAYLVVDRVVRLANNFGVPPTPDEISVRHLQALLSQNLLLLAFAVGLCLLMNDARLKDFGIHGSQWLKQIAIGGLAFLASWLPVYLLLLATSAIRSEETVHPFLKLLKKDHRGEILLWISLAVMLAAPLWEEFAYRVVLQSSLCRWIPAVVAVTLTAVVFSAVHGWPDMLPLFPLAMILGAVYYYYRSYLAVVTTHALFNGAMLAMALVEVSKQS